MRDSIKMKTVITKELLIDKIINNNMSMKDLAQEIHCTTGNILYHLKKHKLHKKSIYKIEDSDILGKTFDNWTVLHKVPKDHRRGVYWLCQCKCGAQREHRSYELIKNNYKQCITCHNKDLGHKKQGCNNYNWVGCGEITGTFWCSIKNSARKRKIGFEITIEEAWKQFEKQRGLCALSGRKLQFARKMSENVKFCTASLDRIDSTNGYIKDNIQWIHKDINRMKSIFDEQYFINTCQEIVEYRVNSKVAL